MFSVHDIRPWLSHESHALDAHYPLVRAHPALNPVVQVIDRKAYGRRPRDLDDLLDIPAQFLVIYCDGDIGWRRGPTLGEPHERTLLREFESRFSRSERLPCSPVSSHPITEAQDDGYGSPRR